MLNRYIRPIRCPCGAITMGRRKGKRCTKCRKRRQAAYRAVCRPVKRGPGSEYELLLRRQAEADYIRAEASRRGVPKVVIRAEIANRMAKRPQSAVEGDLDLAATHDRESSTIAASG